jgi:hypothetical protein
MNELYLGVGGAGAVVIAGVMVYNAWQGAKVRRRLPQQATPTDAETTVGRVPGTGLTGDFNDERPFIEPAANPLRHTGTGDAQQARREPSFGGGGPDSDPDAAARTQELDAAAVPAVALAGAQTPLDQTAQEAAGEAEIAEALSAPPAAPVSTGILDRRIDCIVPIRLGGPVSYEKLAPLAQRLRRAGSKPVFIEGRPEGHVPESQAWDALQAGGRYDEIRVGVQLANRAGALNELEFSEFVSGVQFIVEAVDGGPDFPDMLETVQMARELDGFAAQCDAQLSVNVVSDGAPWSANYVQAIASQDGLLLSRDGTRFVKLDARQNPVFMLQFEDTNFLRDDLTYKGGEMITLLLDVPVADEDILPFRLMCDYAVSLSQRIGAHVVDDQRRPLSENALLAIEKQLMTLYARLEQAGISAGSPIARRLFSN